MANVSEIHDLAQALGLWNIAGGKVDIMDETVSNLDYFYNVLNAELEMRKAKNRESRRKESGLPKKAFDKSKITQGLAWQLQNTERFDFKSEIQNYVIVGACATGKTSLACEVGGYALNKGARVHYVQLEDMLIAIRNNSSRWNRILKSDMVIIDDVFYVTPTDEELKSFYRAVTFLSETHSIIIVTNRLLSEWTKMGVDKHLAETLRKRLMANAQLIHLK